MTLLKSACYTIAAASILTFAASAHANSRGVHATPRVVNAQPFVCPRADNGKGGNFALTPQRFRTGNMLHGNFLGSSSTSTFFYLKGVRNFEKSNLDKAEQAFQAALRADGSKAMDRLTLHFLTLIKGQQGNEIAAKEYAEAYFALAEK